MIPFVPTDSLVEYGHLSGYLQPPTHDQQLNGVVPLDSLPASWWNWLWNKVTSHVNVIGQKFDAVCEEINNVLAEAGITPTSEDTAQLASAIKLMSRNIATANIPGAVLSSNNPGAVKVDSDGHMCVNKFGDYNCLCTTDTTSIVSAINESYSLASDTAACIPDIYTCIGSDYCLLKIAVAEAIYQSSCRVLDYGCIIFSRRTTGSASSLSLTGDAPPGASCIVARAVGTDACGHNTPMWVSVCYGCIYVSQYVPRTTTGLSNVDIHFPVQQCPTGIYPGETVIFSTHVSFAETNGAITADTCIYYPIYSAKISREEALCGCLPGYICVSDYNLSKSAYTCWPSSFRILCASGGEVTISPWDYYAQSIFRCWNQSGGTILAPTETAVCWNNPGKTIKYTLSTPAYGRYLATSVDIYYNA